MLDSAQPLLHFLGFSGSRVWKILMAKQPKFSTWPKDSKNKRAFIQIFFISIFHKLGCNFHPVIWTQTLKQDVYVRASERTCARTPLNLAVAYVALTAVWPPPLGSRILHVGWTLAKRKLLQPISQSEASSPGDELWLDGNPRDGRASPRAFGSQGERD